MLVLMMVLNQSYEDGFKSTLSFKSISQLHSDGGRGKDKQMHVQDEPTNMPLLRT
jgi:hypothetical protein